MKKRVIIILSTVHLILWIFFLLASIIEKYTFHAPEMEPLDFALSKAMYNIFIIVAAAGIINAVVLLLSLRRALLHIGTERSGKRVAACRLALIATILFYSSVVLLFLVNTAKIVIVPIAWFLCELCCGILLAIPTKKKAKRV